MCRDISDAWRHKDNVADARSSGYQSATEGAQAPHILPVGAMPKHVPTVKAGDPCTRDGADGVWTDDGNRTLYCKVQPMPITRVPHPSGDAVPRIMDAATAEQIKDEAWRAYVHDITNAWRS